MLVEWVLSASLHLHRTLAAVLVLEPEDSLVAAAEMRPALRGLVSSVLTDLHNATVCLRVQSEEWPHLAVGQKKPLFDPPATNRQKVLGCQAKKLPKSSKSE